METLTVGAVVVGSFATAFLLQKALLEVLLRALNSHQSQERHARQ